VIAPFFHQCVSKGKRDEKTSSSIFPQELPRILINSKPMCYLKLHRDSEERESERERERARARKKERKKERKRGLYRL
jgi:hypothetical protein